MSFENGGKIMTVLNKNKTDKTDFDQVVCDITQNYISDEVFVTKENRRLPGRSNIIVLIKRLRSLMFPGYFEEKNFCGNTCGTYSGFHGRLRKRGNGRKQRK